MKIAIVAPEVLPVPPVRGGAVETVIEEVARRLTGHEVHVLSVADPELPLFEKTGHRTYHRYAWTLRDRLLLSHWRLPFRRYTSPWYYSPYSRWVARELTVLKPDVVWIHNRIHHVRYISKALPDAHILLSIHNLSAVEVGDVWDARVTSAIRTITGCSNGVKRELCRRRPECSAKTVVLYNGVDVDAFPAWWSEVAQRRSLRANLGLGEGPVILYVGRLVPQKAVHVVLDAFAEVATTDRSARLLVVGSYTFSDNRVTPYIQRLKAKAESVSDQVLFIGHVSRSEIYRYFVMSDILAFPSTSVEAFGLVVIEAMAAGLAVVAFEDVGAAEVIEDGRNGLVVDRASGAGGFSRALVRLSRDPELCERLGRNARCTVEERLTWGSVANKVLSLITAGQASQGNTNAF